MRIKVGRGSWVDLDTGKGHRQTAAMKKAANQISGMMFNDIMTEAASVSPEMLMKLVKRIRLAANMEAARLMDVVSEVLSRNVKNAARPGGFNDGFMRHRNPISAIDKKTSGSVIWAPLTDRYYWAKARDNRGAQDKFFERSGELKNYLSSEGRMITNQFGGVKVEVKLKGMARDRYANTGHSAKALAAFKATSSEPLKSFEEAFLGRITVKIFPNISPTLLPMLSSRRWSDVIPMGGFEEAYVSNQTMRQRLSGPPGEGSQRHLLLPITQFFILNRIPTTIRHTITQYIGRIQLHRTKT